MSEKSKAEKTLEKLYKKENIGGSATLTNGVLEVGKPVEYPSKRSEEDMHEEFEHDDIEEQEMVRIPARRMGKKDKSITSPVENEEPIPLIPNIEANARNLVSFIRVNKRTPPGEGFKGDIPSSVDLNYVARRWGDGIYDFEAYNQDHAVLRRNPNVKIAVTGNPEGMSAQQRPVMQTPTHDPEMAVRLLERQAQQHDKDAERSQKLSDKTLDVTQRMSESYATMVREDGKVRGERDRDFFRAQNEQQTNMFQSLLMQMQTMHQQSMEQQRESFNQTIQIMQMNNQQTQAMNNPAVLFSLFEKGLKFGQDMGGETDPAMGILDKGLAGLGIFKDMMSLNPPRQNPALPPQTSPASVSKPKSDKKPPLERNELMEVIKLKKLAQAKGYEFDSLVKQAQMLVGNAPLQEEEEVEDEPEEGEDEDTEETSET